MSGVSIPVRSQILQPSQIHDATIVTVDTFLRRRTVTKRPPNEADLRGMFGLLEEMRIELSKWAPGSQTPTEEMQ